MSAEKRGRWIRSDTPEGYEWEGPERWVKVRGSATIAFWYGEIDRVDGCLLPDGTRRTVEWHKWEGPRPPTTFYFDDQGARHRGEIEIDAEEVRFIPARLLEDDILASPRIRGLAQEDGFALRLYAALCNNRWIGRGYQWHTGFSEAAQLVARLRGSDGSDYVEIRWWREDTFPDNPPVREGDVADDVANELGLLGWRVNNEPWDAGPYLDDDLETSARIKSLVQDRHFAERLYRALCYVIWLRDDCGWCGTPIDAGMTLVKLRNLGESLADFTEFDGEGLISDDVRTELAALGWVPKMTLIKSYSMAKKPAKPRNRDAIKVDANSVHGVADGWFTPGAGKAEWFKDLDVGPEMVVVPAGSFLMGSPASEPGRYHDEGPQHTVTFAKPFAVARFAVTFDEWDAGVADGGCNGYRPSDAGWGRGNRPVIFVDWDDARAYVDWLVKKTGKTYRLLSEAEYEYAARAGTTTAYPWGAVIGENNANCIGCGSRWDSKQPAQVGSFAPNSFGLYDMAGNVLEWTEDCYHDSYNGAPTDGSAWTSGDCNIRVIRGGSWNDLARTVRSADRQWGSSGERFGTLGFRVARILLPA